MTNAISTSSSLSHHSGDDRFVARTTFSCDDFQTLKAWREARKPALDAIGAKMVRFSGRKIFRAIECSSCGTYSDIRHYFEVWYEIADQDAAEEMHQQVLFGTYATRASSKAYREDLMALAGRS